MATSIIQHQSSTRLQIPPGTRGTRREKERRRGRDNVCVRACVFVPFILDAYRTTFGVCGRASRGHTGGRSQEFFFVIHTPSFCDVCLKPSTAGHLRSPLDRPPKTCAKKTSTSTVFKKPYYAGTKGLGRLQNSCGRGCYRGVSVRILEPV